MTITSEDRSTFGSDFGRGRAQVRLSNLQLHLHTLAQHRASSHKMRYYLSTAYLPRQRVFGQQTPCQYRVFGQQPMLRHRTRQ
eukprot:1460138-Rhodomonas_salina.4